MSMGAPRAKVFEVDLSEVLPNFRGITAGLVGDWERGSVEHAEFSETVKQFVEKTGKPNPRLYGIAQYSGINFLRRSKGLWHARVDRGQLYSSVLVRGIIEPYVDMDADGFAMEKPLVDPIVKPNGGLTKAQIEGYQFLQYPTKREVASFDPVISLTDLPLENDTVFYVDNSAPVSVGSKVTFRSDYTGMTPEQVRTFKVYTVTQVEERRVHHDWIELDAAIPANLISNTGTEIQVQKKTYAPFSPVTVETLSVSPSGATEIHVASAPIFTGGEKIKFTNYPDVYEVTGAATASTTFASPTYALLVAATNAQANPTFVSSVNPVPALAVGDIIQVKGTPFTITGITNPSTGVWNIATTGNFAQAETLAFEPVLKQVASRRITLTSALTTEIRAGEGVLLESIGYEDYAQEVIGKFVDQAKLWVSNNDPVAEGDAIKIGAFTANVTSKFQVENNVHALTVDQKYVRQLGAVAGIGSQVFNVTQTDFEFRDALLVYEKSPGIWGNKIAVGVTDSRNYEEAFVITVYYDGVPILGEEYEVTREAFIDGHGKQMEILEKINNASSYIQVKNNVDLVDDSGKLLEPLKTTYYLRQPLPTPIYTPAAQLQESAFNGDNLLRVLPADIAKFDIDAKVMVEGKEYAIASFQPSVVGGALDTIVLKKGLDMNFAVGTPLNQQKLNVGANISYPMSRKQVKTYSVTMQASPAVAGNAYTVYAGGVAYTFTATGGETLEGVIDGLVGVIDADTNCPFDAVKLVPTPGAFVLSLVAKRAGITSQVSTDGNFTEISSVDAARPYQYHQLQRIDNSVIPSVKIDSVATFAGGVQYTVRDAGANQMSGGFDGPLPTVGQFILTARNNFTERDVYDVMVLMDGGITNVSYQKALVDVVEKRADSIALLSVSYEAQVNPDPKLGPIKYRQDLGVDSSWAGLYSPWVKVMDEYNNFRIWLPIESDAASSLAYLADEKEIWEAMAGWKNALINRAEDVGQRYGEQTRGLLYDYQINTVRVDKRGRKAIYGQRTLQVRPSATDRLNVRCGLIAMGRSLREYLDENTFVINDEITRRKFYLDVESAMLDFKARRAVYDFVIVCDTENNTDRVITTNQLFIDVYVKPTIMAEYMTGRLVVTRYGIDFQQVQLGQPNLG